MTLVTHNVAYEVVSLHHICAADSRIRKCYLVPAPLINLLICTGLPTSVRARLARLFLHQILHNRLKMDSSKYLSFSKTCLSHHKHPHTLTAYSFHNNTFQYSFFPLAVKEWNKLDRTLSNTDCFSTFCNLLDKAFTGHVGVC